MNTQLNEEAASKKALWVSPELHKQIEIFKAVNDKSFEEATHYLISLGICSHELEAGNDTK
jgi:hypothetical protein